MADRITPVCSADEMERRRAQSIEEMKRRQAAAWNEEYQEICDKEYFRLGPCCAGCDHWSSYAGLTGGCMAGGILSGDDVMRSAGLHSATYTPAPGYPLTKHDHKCSLFKDDFDWSSLDPEYLQRIGYRDL